MTAERSYPKGALQIKRSVEVASSIGELYRTSSYNLQVKHDRKFSHPFKDSLVFVADACN